MSQKVLLILFKDSIISYKYIKNKSSKTIIRV
jgi:hypothetical protein